GVQTCALPICRRSRRRTIRLRDERCCSRRGSRSRLGAWCRCSFGWSWRVSSVVEESGGRDRQSCSVNRRAYATSPLSRGLPATLRVATQRGGLSPVDDDGLGPEPLAPARLREKRDRGEGVDGLTAEVK